MMSRYSLRKAGLVLLTGILLAGLAGWTANAMVIAKDGTPAATIVISADAGDKVRSAAAELQSYIEKISGAKLPLATDGDATNGPVILVGRSKLTDAANVKIPSGLTHARREEGFVIHCRGDRLILAGNNQGSYHGTQYAVYEFLERLGVRWFMPGEFGEIVPELATIRFADVQVRETPDFVMRSRWFMGRHLVPEANKLDSQWKLRNKMSPTHEVSQFKMGGDSSVRTVIDKALFKEHPEYFAMNADGTRTESLPSLSHPKAVEIAAGIIKKHFRDNPEENAYAMAPDDGRPRDWDPETLKWHHGFTDLMGRDGVPAEASTSEEWFRFVNLVTAEVRKEFPDIYISTNGYANRNIPPQGVTLDDHLVILFCANWCDTYHAYDNPKSWQTVRQGQMLQEWTSQCDNVWIYDYNYVNLVSALTAVPRVRKLARDFPLMKEWGVMGFIAETRNAWMESGITTRYVRANLQWDADADVEAILDDYFEKWYGRAAVPARDFWDALEETMEETPMLGHEDRFMPGVYTPALFEKLEKAVAEAEQLADTDRTQLHVQVDRLTFEHLKRYMDMRGAEFEADFAAAAEHAGRMMDVRKKLSGISPVFCLPDEDTSASGIWYWGVTHRKRYYESLAAKTSGETGDLVALLPTAAKFRTDPRDEGRFAGWFDPEAHDGDWETILTTKSFLRQGYMDEVGYPHMGYIWYRLEVDVPEEFAGRKIMLYAPILETEAWGWVNGNYVGHREYREAYIRPAEMELDVTDAVAAGKTNVIAIRVGTGLNAAQAANGLMSRLFMYAPKDEE